MRRLNFDSISIADTTVLSKDLLLQSMSVSHIHPPSTELHCARYRSTGPDYCGDGSALLHPLSVTNAYDPSKILPIYLTSCLNGTPPSVESKTLNVNSTQYLFNNGWNGKIFLA